MGVYPMLADDTCRFLAADFDKETWRRDAGAYLDACRAKGIPAALERSRSGNGAHVWFFFEDPVPASLARRLGAHLLTEAMEHNPDIGFRSYDRFFPSQDTVPQGGFGNLIALPLQGGPRENGHSVFLDADFEPWPDQWAFLSGLRRLTEAEAGAIVEEAGRLGRVVGLRLPLDDDEEPWTAPPSRRRPLPAIAGVLPERIAAVLADQVYIPREGLPPGLVDRLVRLAAFQNPAFYAAQAMRRSTFGTPRVVACAELLSHHIALPRGCLEAMEHLLEELGIGLDLRDERFAGRPFEAAFLGELTLEQAAAADALLQHDIGVLAATTAFGKTVVAASLLGARRANTLVLVHRRQLMDQWIARLGAFLDLPVPAIGQIGGGKRKPTGVVDVAVIQSLVRGDEVDDIVADYGHLIVDECHHLSAVSFEKVARRAKSKFVLGLSATVTRQDGHHPIVFMQCGPVRFRASAQVPRPAAPIHASGAAAPDGVPASRRHRRGAPADPADLCGACRGRGPQRPDLRRCAERARSGPLTARPHRAQGTRSPACRTARPVRAERAVPSWRHGGEAAPFGHAAPRRDPRCRRAGPGRDGDAISARGSTTRASIRCSSRCRSRGGGPSRSMSGACIGYIRPSARFWFTTTSTRRFPR